MEEIKRTEDETDYKALWEFRVQEYESLKAEHEQLKDEVYEIEAAEHRYEAEVDILQNKLKEKDVEIAMLKGEIKGLRFAVSLGEHE